MDFTARCQQYLVDMSKSRDQLSPKKREVYLGLKEAGIYIEMYV
jgi:hypothetical protein